jgi:hypothetical protein
MSTVTFLPDIQRPEPGPGEAAGVTARVGDTVTWTDPRTKAVWSDLVVETVYAMQAKASVWGCFGRYDGNAALSNDSRRVSLLDCVVTRRKGENI